MHSDDDKWSNTEKRVNTAKDIEKYEDTLLNIKVMRQKIKIIKSRKHRIGTYEIKKTSLLCFDDNRFVLENDIWTLAYFYKNF